MNRILSQFVFRAETHFQVKSMPLWWLIHRSTNGDFMRYVEQIYAILSGAFTNIYLYPMRPSMITTMMDDDDKRSLVCHMQNVRILFENDPCISFTYISISLFSALFFHFVNILNCLCVCLSLSFSLA